MYFEGISLSWVLWWLHCYNNCFIKLQKLTLTFMMIQLAAQCQSKGSLLNALLLKKGAWDFKKGLISLHNGTLCSDSNRDDTERYKKHTDWSLWPLCWHCVSPKQVSGSHCIFQVVNCQGEPEQRIMIMHTSIAVESGFISSTETKKYLKYLH